MCRVLPQDQASKHIAIFIIVFWQWINTYTIPPIPTHRSDPGLSIFEGPTEHSGGSNKQTSHYICYQENQCIMGRKKWGHEPVTAWEESTLMWSCAFRQSSLPLKGLNFCSMDISVYYLCSHFEPLYQVENSKKYNQERDRGPCKMLNPMRRQWDWVDRAYRVGSGCNSYNFGETMVYTPVGKFRLAWMQTSYPWALFWAPSPSDFTNRMTHVNVPSNKMINKILSSCSETCLFMGSNKS